MTPEFLSALIDSQEDFFYEIDGLALPIPVMMDVSNDYCATFFAGGEL